MVPPGLYAIGVPTQDDPVVVTAKCLLCAQFHWLHNLYFSLRSQEGDAGRHAGYGVCSYRELTLCISGNGTVKNREDI